MIYINVMQSLCLKCCYLKKTNEICADNYVGLHNYL